MASDPQIVGFNPDEVRAGLHLAMQVGLPIDIADQPTFVFPEGVALTGDKRDSEGTPFDFRAEITRTRPDVTYQVPCAIEYMDGEGKIENFGIVVPSRIKLTLLDQDYEIVQGFSWVLVGGNRYYYRRTEPPIGLVSVGIWTVHCQSEDEG